MKRGTIITIGRQCGSGGHEIGMKLAEKLGIPYYDKELLRLAAQQSGLAPENFELYDEVPTNSLLYSLSLGNYGMAMHQFDVPIHQKIFLAQFETIQALADKGESCVILGRCSSTPTPRPVWPVWYSSTATSMRRRPLTRWSRRTSGAPTTTIFTPIPAGAAATATT